MMRRLLPHYVCGTMNAAAPDWAPPRRINNYSKNTLPSVPRRGPEEGVLPYRDDFHGSGVNVWVHASFYNAFHIRKPVLPRGIAMLTKR